MVGGRVLWLLRLVLPMLVIGGILDGTVLIAAQSGPVYHELHAYAETTPRVVSRGSSADDPAIVVFDDKPESSLVVCTYGFQGRHGLASYTLRGVEQQL